MLTADVSVTIEPVMSPSKLSNAVAPASEYDEPACTVSGSFPNTVIVGAVESTTLTVLVAWVGQARCLIDVVDNHQ